MKRTTLFSDAGGKPSRFRWSYLVFGVVLALSFVSVVRALASEKATTPRASDAKVSERKLAGANDEKLFVPEGDWLSGQGIVEPRDRETKVSPDVGGRIDQVVVKEGDHVKAGDAIVLLDARVEKAEAEASEADLAQQKAELARMLAGDRHEDRMAADAEARSADAKAIEATSVAERTKKAFDGGGATGDELDRAAREADAAKASAELSRARLAASQHGSRLEDVDSAKARVEASKARLDEANARLAERTVRSPIDGEVLSLKVRAGEYTQPGGDPVAIVGDTSLLRVRVDIDERDLAHLALGAKILARANAFPGVDFGGKVVEIGRRMGRKNVRTDDPIERNDTKILEVVAELESTDKLVVGERVVAFVASQ